MTTNEHFSTITVIPELDELTIIDARRHFFAYKEKGIVRTGLFDEDKWILSDERDNRGFDFSLDEAKFHDFGAQFHLTSTDFEQYLKTFIVCNLGNLSLTSLQHIILAIKRVVYAANGEITSSLFESELPWLHYVTDFLSMLPTEGRNEAVDALLQQCDDTWDRFCFSRAGKQRTLATFESYFRFHDVLKRFWAESVNEEEKLFFFPVWLWWNITGVVPMRPHEFVLTPRDCLEVADGKFYITLRKNKIKGSGKAKGYRISEDYQNVRYQIPAQLGKEIQWYLAKTRDCSSTEIGTLFVTTTHYRMWQRSAPYTSRYFTYTNLKTCLRYYYKDILQGRYGYRVLMNYWNDELNGGHKPSEYSASSSEKVWTNCPICGTPVKRNVRFTWAPDENGVGRVIHCRTCGKRKPDNTLTEVFPSIVDYWVYDKNRHKPEYYTISSGKKEYILCPDCGKERYIAICDALTQDSDGTYRVTSCVECARKKQLDLRRQKDSNIAKACPKVDLYWDEKNEYAPNELTLYNLTKVYTHCPTCGKLLHRKAANTFREIDGVWYVLRCQRCAASEADKRRAMLNNGPVILECPELGEWWDSRNEIGPDKVTRGSHYEAYLTCPACHLHLRRDIHTFVSTHRDGRLLPVACPACGYSSKGDPEDNLLKVCPEIADWWDYEANAPFRPEQFTKGSQFMAHLNCPDCGMDLYTGIHSLLHTDENGNIVISHKGRCRKYRAMESDNNLVTCYPQVKTWWDYEENKPHLPEEYTLFSAKQAHFQCPSCGTKTHRRIVDAFVLDEHGVPVLFKCPYCSGAKATPGVNSLAALYPKLAAECLSADDPERILASSSSRMKWKCPDCGGQWFDLVSNRVNGAGCPYCSERKPSPGYNTLQAKHPDLIAKEWAVNENTLIGLDPDRILDSSTEPAWWNCPQCHHPYIMSPKNRLLKLKRGHNPCTFCNGRRIPSPRFIL